MLDQLKNAAGIGGDDTPGRQVIDVEVDRIDPDPDQPRKSFDAIDELAASIQAVGVQQPLQIRLHPEEDGRFLLVAGERRLRAAQQAKLATVPCLVEEGEVATDTHLRHVVQLTENLQRRDLPILDTARALEAILEATGWPKGELARVLGKSANYVSKHLALLKAEGPAREALEQGLIESPETLRLFNRLPEDRQQELLEGARQAGEPLSRGEVEEVEREEREEEDGEEEDAGADLDDAGENDDADDVDDGPQAPAAQAGEPAGDRPDLYTLQLTADQLVRVLRRFDVEPPAEEAELVPTLLRLLDTDDAPGDDAK
jgi:ParB family chromosome partitioning protein